MASTLPNLTFNRTVNTTPGSVNSISSVISSLITLIGTLMYWEVKASSTDYILIGPIAGGNVDDCRILIGGDGSGPNSGQMYSPHTTSGNILFAGIAPDTGIDALVNAWNSASNPFDSDRFSGYVRISQDISANNVDYYYIIESAETFSIWFHENSGDTNSGFHAGAIISPPDDVDGEGTPGRIWGILTSGSLAINSNFAASSNEFLSSGIGVSSSLLLCFDPITPSSIISLDRIVTFSAPVANRLQTASGTAFFMPIFLYNLSGGNNGVGVYRQMALWELSTSGSILQDSSFANQAYIVGANSSSSNDCVILYNKS